MKQLSLHVDKAHQGWRLDVFLSHCQSQNLQLKGLSRTRLQQLIREGCVSVAGQVVLKPNHRLAGEEQITLRVPEPEPAEARPEALPLSILYQDTHLAVIDKAAGMVVHPSGGRVTGTLVNALLHHLTDLSGIGGQLRPGIVHRLDKGTSGLLLVAKDDETHQGLTQAFKERRIQKTYLALVEGRLSQPQGVIEFPLARHRTQRHKIAAVMGEKGRTGRAHPPERRAKAAVTRYEVRQSWETVSFLALHPETGRTHQIRVHLSQLGHPVLGDSTYGYRWHKAQHIPRPLIDHLDGLALHAWKLALEHPISGQALRFEAPLPDRMQKLLDHLSGLEQYKS